MRLTLHGTTYEGEDAAAIVELMRKSTPFSREMSPMDFRKAQLDSWWVNGYRFRVPAGDPTPEDVIRGAVECGIGKVDDDGRATTREPEVRAAVGIEGGPAAGGAVPPGGGHEMAAVITALDALAVRVASRRPAGARRRAADERERGVQGWGGAGVIWATNVDCFNPRWSRADPLVVVTPHAHAVGRVIREMPVGALGFHWNKDEFYERLARASIAYQHAVGADETERGMCLAVLAEARALAVECLAGDAGARET